MDHRSHENFFVVVSPGLEEACAAELAGLGIGPLTIESGGVVFSGRLRELYLANLHLRTASRILVRFAAFNSRDFPDLFRRSLKLPWGRFLRPETAVTFRVTCRTSRLGHSERVAETLTDALNRTLGRAVNAAGVSPQLILVRIVDDHVVLSIDSTGELLHRRGYRQTVTLAPLRETLAAGALQLLGWDGTTPLADPLCGSGSFLTEGALIARHRAPGLDRSFAFSRWPGWREGLWTLLCDEARRAEVSSDIVIEGADESLEAVAAAVDNCRRCGVDDQVMINCRPLSAQPVHAGGGLVICNPPYGKRLAPDVDLRETYRELGFHLRRAYPGWRLAMICPLGELPAATGLSLRQVARLDNGGLAVGLFATGGDCRPATAKTADSPLHNEK